MGGARSVRLGQSMSRIVKRTRECRRKVVGTRLFADTSLGWQQTGSHGRGLNLVVSGQWTKLPLSLHRDSEGRNMSLRTVDTADEGILEES